MALTCEYCKSKLRCIESRDIDGKYQVRVKYCPKCKRSYNTTETFDEVKEVVEQQKGAA